MIRFGRIAIAAALVTGGLAVLETQAARAGADHASPPSAPIAAPMPALAPAAPLPEAGPAAEKPACPRVKVVYFGYGEAERSPCRAAAR